MSTVPTSSRSTDAAPSLLLRLAAMTYEAVLLFGVVFIASYAVLGLAHWTYPLAPRQRWVLQGILFVVIGAYFVWCWTRSGQTLALKSWHLRVVTRDGGRLTLSTAIARYLLAWLLFLPGLVFIALFQTHAAIDALAFGVGFVTMLLTSYLDPERQLPHDRLLKTRVVREPRRP